MTPNIGTLHKRITAVGSRVTCNPPPLNTDQDWLVLVAPETYDAFAAALLADGWEVGGSMVPADTNYLPAQERFNSFTKGDDNVIATASEEFHKRFLAATSVAKTLNLLEKSARVALFQAVLYGNPCNTEFYQVTPFDLDEVLA